MRLPPASVLDRAVAYAKSVGAYDVAVSPDGMVKLTLRLPENGKPAQPAGEDIPWTR